MEATVEFLVKHMNDLFVKENIAESLNDKAEVLTIVDNFVIEWVELVKFLDLFSDFEEIVVLVFFDDLVVESLFNCFH